MTRLILKVSAIWATILFGSFFTVFGADIKVNTTADFSSGDFSNLLISNGSSGKVTLDYSYARLGPFNAGTYTLPIGLSQMGVITANGRLYVAGGISTAGERRKDVSSTQLGNLGSIGAWRAENALPIGEAGGGFIFSGGRFYLTANDGSGTIYSSQVNSADGSLGAWVTAGNLPPAIKDHRLVIIGKRLALAAADGAGTFFSAPILANGNVGSWRAEPNLPIKAVGYSLSGSTSRIFLTGGSDTSSTLSAKVFSISVDATGTFGSWSPETNLPAGVAFSAISCDRGLLVVSGGMVGTNVTNAIYSAQIQSDGHLGPWQQEGNFLAASVKDNSSILWNGFLISVGGDNGIQKISQISFQALDFDISITGINKVGPAPGFSNTAARAIGIGNRMYSSASLGDASVKSLGVSANGDLETSWRTEASHGSSSPSLAASGALVYVQGRMFFLEYPILALNVPAIYSTEIAPDGSLKGWSTAGSAPRKLSGYSVASAGNRIYLFGGRDDGGGLLGNPQVTVYSAVVGSDGSLGTWQTEFPLPKGLNGCGIAISGRKVIVSGGQVPGQLASSGSDIYLATILTDGHLSNWTSIGSLPTAVQNHRTIVSGGLIVLGGGYSWSGSPIVLRTNPNVYAATIDDAGNIGSWTSAVNPVTEMSDMVNCFGRFFLIGSDGVYSLTRPVFNFEGSYFSSRFDLGNPRNLSSVSWERIANPSNTGLLVSVAIANDSTGAMDSFSPIVNGLNINKVARYAQLRFDLKSLDGSQTSGLDSFTLSHFGDYTHPDNSPQLSVVSASTSSITLSLNDRSLDESGFDVFFDQINPPLASSVRINSVTRSSGTPVTVTLSNLAHGATYYIRAKGFNSADSIAGAYSNVVSTMTLIPKGSSLLTVVPTVDSYVLLWTAQPNVKGYRVFDEKGTSLITTSSNTFRFNQGSLSPNTSYSRRVEAFDDFGPIQIGSVTFYTLLQPPTLDDFRVSGRGEDWIEITINPPFGAGLGSSGAKVTLAASNVTPISKVLTKGITTARFDGLPVGHTYSIKASYLNGDGVETAEVDGTPVFAGLAGESFAPSVTKFRISDGIDFDIDSNSPVSGTLHIYDSNQRMIRQLDFNNGSGHSAVHWDGRDGSGNQVFSDVFWVKSESDHFGRNTFKVAGVR